MDRTSLPYHSLYVIYCFACSHLFLFKCCLQTDVTCVVYAEFSCSLAPTTRTDARVAISILKNLKGLVFIRSRLVVYNFVDFITQVPIFLFYFLYSFS
jgi:hypothetical protein